MEKFYLGLDIGTNSVGIACTDEEYKILRAKGKDLWAVRLFDEAQTAEKRRTFRTSRRRVARRQYRIDLLQNLFEPYIEDGTFFLRLNNSQFFPEDKDKSINTKYVLFGDTGFTDVDFYKRFPTIYHLRSALIKGEEKFDLRFYYLALHHIIKYRGHFLFEGDMAKVRDLSELFLTLNSLCGERLDVELNFDPAKAEEFKQIALGNGYLKDKQKSAYKLFDLEAKEKSAGKALVDLILGSKVAPKKIFTDNESDEYGKGISFKEINTDEFEAKAMDFGDDFALLDCARTIYNCIVFEKILGSYKYISDAMIGLYDKHKEDLGSAIGSKTKSGLKAYIYTRYGKETYDKVFKSTTETSNYVNYIGYTKVGKKKVKVKKCKYDDFKKFIKTYLVGDDEETKKYLASLEDGTFLPKILKADNGVFPHQINELELDEIIKKMVEAYPQTAEIKDKIEKIFKHRIPYYVGPLAGANSWIVRKEGKENDKILPWTFDDIVDKAKSNEQFMRRMTSKCTYLKREDVLPKASILYQRYNTLNQINKLTVNGAPIDVETKQKIFNELFLQYKKVSDKMIKDLLVRVGKVSSAKDCVLGGKDEEFNASMSSYIQFVKTLGKEFVDHDLDFHEGVCENIILWHTLNTDKNVVIELIKQHYSSVKPVMDHLKDFKGMVFRDFGKLSEKLLCSLSGSVEDRENGVQYHIIDELWRTNQNLNEILYSEKYGFKQAIDAENGDESSDITYSDLEEEYVSPAVRRGIWQSLIMVDEYVKALGKTPDKIFVEVTREDGDKGKKTLSRKKQLQTLYKNIDGIGEIAKELDDDSKVSDFSLRQERLYLYFRQLGKCAYTGEPIDLSALNTDTYDVDHILPRTYIKDDSLDNKVLVKRSANAKKTDTYPVPAEFQKQKPFWEMLRDKGLMSAKQYARLTRVEPLGDDDFEGFINRQKTITDQTVKVVAKLLQRKYPDSKIVYSKAKNVSDFRSKFDLYKCRETNDLHHARDAYLNVVVGNVYDSITTHYRKGNEWREYNLKTLFERDRIIKGVWEDKAIEKVKDNYSKTSMIVTRYSYVYNGEFYNQTVYRAGDSGITAPRKLNSPLADTTKYGGYKSQNPAFFVVVQSEISKGSKTKIIKTVEPIPVIEAKKIEKGRKTVEEYLSTYLSNPVVLVRQLKLKSLLKYNGTPVLLAGGSAIRLEFNLAYQFHTDNVTDKYVKALTKLNEQRKNNKTGNYEDKNEFVVYTNRFGKRDEDFVINKENNLKLYDKIAEQFGNKIFSGLTVYASLKNKMADLKESFENTSVINQVIVLLSLLNIFGGTCADLSIINGGTETGRCRPSKDITDVNLEVVNMSPCGLTCKVKKV